MLDWTHGLPGQIRAALQVCAERGWPPPGPPARAVFVCGMGGSALAGDAARTILLDQLEIPLSVGRDSDLPAWVGPGTLVIAVSYSGNTWETGRALRAARERGAETLAVTSGGALAAEAQAERPVVFLLPGGYAPRAALGWMLVPTVLGALRGSPLPRAISEIRGQLEEAATVLEEEISLWRKGGAYPGRDPQAIASELAERVAFVYAPSAAMFPAARRWMTQLQENAKQAACAAAIPELFHNEIVGWRFAAASLPAVHLVLEDSGSTEATRIRVANAAWDELAACGARVCRIPSRGHAPAARLLSHILLADRVSVEVARRRGIDPVPVEAIERVKAACGKERS
jgi:glucose/mannose-6-phosphate isomerase